MSSSTLYRLSGIALLIGSALSIIYSLSNAFINDSDLTQLAGPVSVYGSLIGFVGSLLVLLGLPGLYLRQAKPTGVPGFLAFALVWYVTLFQGILIPFTSVTIVPLLVTTAATRSLLATGPLSSFTPFFIPSLIGQTVGILLLAMTALRARIFPRWPSWILIAALVLVVVSLLPFIPGFLGGMASQLTSVAIAGYGFALLWPERLERAQTAPASTEAAMSTAS